ncbi:hypothetical protein BGX28_003673 [Mortierella sp. GBA30]|nr:hypothetical protein BGX28_003673 [Mortierella sp. GBA30]
MDARRYHLPNKDKDTNQLCIHVGAENVDRIFEPGAEDLQPEAVRFLRNLINTHEAVPAHLRGFINLMPEGTYVKRENDIVEENLKSDPKSMAWYTYAYCRAYKCPTRTAKIKIGGPYKNNGTLILQFRNEYCDHTEEELKRRQNEKISLEELDLKRRQNERTSREEELRRLQNERISREEELKRLQNERINERISREEDIKRLQSERINALLALARSERARQPPSPTQPSSSPVSISTPKLEGTHSGRGNDGSMMADCSDRSLRAPAKYPITAFPSITSASTTAKHGSITILSHASREGAPLYHTRADTLPQGTKRDYDNDSEEETEEELLTKRTSRSNHHLRGAGSRNSRGRTGQSSTRGRGRGRGARARRGKPQMTRGLRCSARIANRSVSVEARTSTREIVEVVIPVRPRRAAPQRIDSSPRLPIHPSTLLDSGEFSADQPSSKDVPAGSDRSSVPGIFEITSAPPPTSVNTIFEPIKVEEVGNNIIVVPSRSSSPAEESKVESAKYPNTLHSSMDTGHSSSPFQDRQNHCPDNNQASTQIQQISGSNGQLSLNQPAICYGHTNVSSSNPSLERDLDRLYLSKTTYTSNSRLRKRSIGREPMSPTDRTIDGGPSNTVEPSDSSGRKRPFKEISSPSREFRGRSSNSPALTTTHSEDSLSVKHGLATPTPTLAHSFQSVTLDGTIPAFDQSSVTSIQTATTAAGVTTGPLHSPSSSNNSNGSRQPMHTYKRTTPGPVQLRTVSLRSPKKLLTQVPIAVPPTATFEDLISFVIPDNMELPQGVRFCVRSQDLSQQYLSHARVVESISGVEHADLVIMAEKRVDLQLDDF